METSHVATMAIGSSAAEGFEAGANKTRSSILEAALRLLTKKGPNAVTTRAVAEAAGIQPPVLYRHFKDKEGLLDALAEYGFATYLSNKPRKVAGRDPVEVLRSGWDSHVEFGLSQPALYVLMYAHARPGVTSPAAELSFSILREHLGEVALSGRLRVPPEQALSLFHAAAVGIVLVLLQTPTGKRDPTISHIARDAALALIADVPAPGVFGPTQTAAITLRAALDQETRFSAGELSLLKEWLNRLGA